MSKVNDHTDDGAKLLVERQETMDHTSVPTNSTTKLTGHEESRTSQRETLDKVSIDNSPMLQNIFNDSLDISSFNVNL